MKALIILARRNKFLLEIDHPLKTHASRRPDDEDQTNLIRVGIEILPEFIQLAGEIDVSELRRRVLNETASCEPAHWQK